MNPNSKPNWLLITFPAILVALLMFGYLRPNRALYALQRTAANMRAAGDRAPQLAQTRTQLEALQTDLTRLEAERAKLVAKWNELRRSVSEHNNRPDSLTKLTDVLTANKLHVLQKQLSTGNTEQSGVWQKVEQRLKQPIENAFPELNTSTATPAAETPPVVSPLSDLDRRVVWELQLFGTYEDVERSLRELIKVDPSVTPLGLEMEEPTPGSKSRKWKLMLAF